ncbi:MAG: hypothetical protein R6W71_05345 [Bacteroidales bacterium]
MSAITGMFFITCCQLTQCFYMKMNPPPDADKAAGGGTNNSCWLATASNMLAGAGYGDGTTVQQRADDIYADMTGNYGIAPSGWTDVALSWWLASANNTWPANPYTLVTVYGHKTRTPYARTDLPMFFGNELRNCQFVGVSISWPPASGGHAITCWGDNINNDTEISINPTGIRVTDSDTDSGGDVQVYTYDDYSNPNPGGSNAGNGWYFDYSANHPFIKHIVTLCPVDYPSGGASTVRVLGSYSISHNSKVGASDLHYVAGTDVDILSYRTYTDWDITLTPAITEASPRQSIDVTWDFGEKAVPAGTPVTITTEFILPSWNAIYYRDVYFSFPDAKIYMPDISWLVISPKLENAERIENVTGGFLLGSFELIGSDEEGNEIVEGKYRFFHEYRYNENPEIHQVYLNGKTGYGVRNLSFGHHYTLLTAKELWDVREWMTTYEESVWFKEEPLEISIDWEGRLPYPQGDGPYNKEYLQLKRQ